jgi:hypothetical protein
MRVLITLFLAASALSAAELDVTRVVLYKHGIGFFERAGQVSASDPAILQFQASEMDDVLKSLTIEQRGGDGVSSVRYDSSDPLAKRLEVFPFRIGEHVSLPDLLDQFKGAEIELAMSSGAIRGTIISARRIVGGENNSIEVQQLVLLTGTGVRTVDPAAASQISFVDPQIQTQFAEYLAILSRSRNTDRRSLTIESQGGASSIIASYITPTPIWKSSYRLVFGTTGEPLLEGWAIVDNTSGEDWENVRLSLVSGLPVSFISSLYAPRYLQRPVIQLAQDRAWRPTVHGGAIEGNAQGAGQNAEAVGGFAGGRLDAVAKLSANAPMPASESMAYRQRVGGSREMMLADQEVRREMSSTVAAQAVKADLGDLFEYAIDKPVTIRKSESAMLPFFRERVSARRLFIYDESNGSQHPLTAAEITNDSGATLDGGAITVYDAGAYAGEALVETIKAGDKRFISYAVDLGTRITTAYDTTSKLQREFHVSRGVLTAKNAQRETKTFTILNVDPEAKTVIIEHPVRQGYKLVDMTATETTADKYRFEVAVAANATVKHAIVEEFVYDQTIGITNLSYDQIMVWVRNKDLSEAGRAQLERIANLKRQIGDNQQEQQRVDVRVNEFSQDENRLRNNINTLRNVAGQQDKVGEYSEQLAGLGGRVVALRDQQAQLRQQADTMQRELNDLVETLEF